jgi:lipopolysaccharide transport system permease protein
MVSLEPGTTLRGFPVTHSVGLPFKFGELVGATRWLVSPSQNWIHVRKILSVLSRNRHLVLEMIRRELRSQVAGQIFGLFWILGHPLIQCLIYIFIFAVVFKAKIDQTVEMPRDYTTYILAGLVPWLFVQQSLTRTASTLVAQANLVKQVVFPVEVLPFCAVLVSLIPVIVGLGVIAVYTLVTQFSLPWTYLLLPLVIIASIALMTGIGVVLAVVTPFFRDIKDMIQVGAIVGVYIIPAFYLPQWVPANLRFIIYLNPFSYLIWVYQDVLYFGQIAHPAAWAIVLVGSFGSLGLGYRTFGALRSFVADVL